MRRDHRARGFSALLAASLAVCLATSLVAPTALAQTAPAAQPRPDVLPDVTIRATPAPDKADVIANRLPRAMVCLGANTWSPDPTGKFNQAYYEELTGQADYYDTIREPPRNLRRSYPPPLHPGELMFSKLSGGNQMPPSTPLFSPTNYQVGPMFTLGKPDCTKRGGMEKDVTFARALAKYDKGDYAAALAGFQEAYRKLRKSSLGGEAALLIAGMYMKGQGVPRDVGQAIVWLENAAALPAVRGYAWRYNPRQPERFYSVRAEAAMALGLIYLTGNGVETNPAKARDWVEVAMRNYHIPAQKAVGDMSYAGYGDRLNLRDALMRYEAAAEYRHAGAMQSAGAMYDAGEGAKANPKKAVLLYREAAGLGDGNAAYTLALMYDAGDRVPVEPETALSLYKIAALGKNAAAMTALGTYFYKGEIVQQDHATARAWFTEAAIRGEADAMVNLAAMLIAGEGGGVDLVRAWAWLTIARDEGREDVAAGLAALQGRMSGDDLAAARALIGPPA